MSNLYYIENVGCDDTTSGEYVLDGRIEEIDFSVRHKSVPLPFFREEVTAVLRIIQAVNGVYTALRRYRPHTLRHHLRLRPADRRPQSFRLAVDVGNREFITVYQRERAHARPCKRFRAPGTDAAQTENSHMAVVQLFQVFFAEEHLLTDKLFIIHNLTIP